MASIIAALDANGIIGHNNSIPWNIPGERKIFRELTTGNVVIMGRKTFESIGKPLPDRINIVVSRTTASVPGAEVYASLKQALEAAKAYKKDLFAIGGAEVYAQALELPVVDTMYLSYLHDSYSADVSKDSIVSFPLFVKDEWKLVEEKSSQLFDVKVYKRLI